MDPLVSLAGALATRGVRFVVIGVADVNYYAHDAGSVFATEDRDLFLPLDPDNLMQCWAACEEVHLELRAGSEPLDRPHDRRVAEHVIEHRDLTSAVAAERAST